MKVLYFSIALLTLYGDVVKRFAAPVVALGIVYAAAICILVFVMLQTRRKVSNSAGRDAQLVNLFASGLIVTYVAQFVTSLDAPFFAGISHLLYIVVPLLYIIVIQKYCPHFSLDKLANPFLLMMIPINMVGVIQFFINPNFLISTAYTGDHLGGVIERNLFDEGFFERFPSIFASADRYSAMALMQFYFSWALLTAGRSLGTRGHLWFGVNMLSSLIALGIAGARSRILIVIVVILLVVVAEIVRLLAFSRVSKRARTNGLMFILAGALVLSTSFALVYFATDEEYPILFFLQQTIQEGDIQLRLFEALQFSLLPRDVSFFGQGLGTVGTEGRPGEYGIQSMWIESGLVWGGITLINFLGLIHILAISSFRSALNGQSTQLVIFTVPLLLLIFGLLAGLTSAFELSTGILIACAIAVAVRRPYANAQATESSQPAWIKA